MTGRLETGIDLLDRKLDGGVPVGSLTAFTAPPASQSELFLYELATVRPTLYLTPLRPPADIHAVIEELPLDAGNLTIETVDPDAPVDATLDHAKQLPDQSTLIIDPVEVYEQLPAQTYWEFLTELRDQIAEANGNGVLHCLDGQSVPPRRDITDYMVDVVFQMTTHRRGETVDNDLIVPKYRGGRAIEDVIRLSLTTNVEVDVSRNIV